MDKRALKILAIDDDLGDFVILERHLRRIEDLRFEAIHCQSFESAQQLLADGAVDCVLLDYQLGAVTGLDLLKAIRDSGNDVPVITCTGQGAEAVAVEAMKRGAQDYLAKSDVTPEALYRAITNAIQKVALTRQIAEKQEELEQFAHVASHDLKSPLSKISMFCELIRDECQGKVEEQVIDYCDIVVKNVQHMSRLIDSLLEYSRVGRKKKSLEPVDLDRVAGTAVSNLEVPIKQSNAGVELAPLPTVLGDEVALLQLLQNLIANAIKFRGQQQPRVQVLACPDQEQWRISVRDNGIGISPDHFQKIFAPFERLHGVSHYEGSGIGLATCKKIVDQHKGAIWVESEPGQGSTFHFTLPRVGEPVAAEVEREGELRQSACELVPSGR